MNFRRNGLFASLFLALVCACTTLAQAAPYAAVVMDARSGEILHSRNSNTRLHPASLTKMMTLYIAFEAVRRGEISLDTKVKISAKAAAEPAIKLGLRKGQRIALRYLIRASAVRSSNDAATAIAEAISGSEAEFARRMNRTAKALGMTRTTFKNAHGLTEDGHMSTARDMTILGRRLLYDYPDYYHLFSRRKAETTMTTVRNTNRRLLNAYRGADGIKTGYTRAAGYNLVASAERGHERIIATMFGGRSAASRNSRVAELLDMGFQRAPSQVAVVKPPLPVYSDSLERLAQTVRPSMRPVNASQIAQASSVPADNGEILNAVKQASQTSSPPTAAFATAQADPRSLEMAILASTPTNVRIVRHDLRTGDTSWSINLGQFSTRHEAEKYLLRVALAELQTLEGSERRVVQMQYGFEAVFLELTRQQADLACRRLTIQQIACKASRSPHSG